MNTESTTFSTVSELSTTPEPATDCKPIFQDVVFQPWQNPTNSKCPEFPSLSPCCPYCFHLSPHLIGVKAVKEKRPGTGKHVHAIARLYFCKHCKHSFVTAERIDSDPMPVWGKSPIGDRLAPAILENRQRIDNHLTQRFRFGSAIITCPVSRAAVYPSGHNGKFRIVFPTRKKAVKCLKAIADAVRHWDKLQQIGYNPTPASEPLNVPPVCEFPTVESLTDELDEPQAESNL